MTSTPCTDVTGGGRSSGYHERRARGFDSDEEILARAIADELIARGSNQKAVENKDNQKPEQVKKTNWKTNCEVGAKAVCRGADDFRKAFFTWRIHVRNENPELFEREYVDYPVMVERGVELDELD